MGGQRIGGVSRAESCFGWEFFPARPDERERSPRVLSGVIVRVRLVLST
jgi:hypothetical protein